MADNARKTRWFEVPKWVGVSGFVAAAILGCIVLFSLFREQLLSWFGLTYVEAVSFSAQPWHWVVLLGALWASLTVGVAGVYGVYRGQITAGFVAMFLGFGAWALGQTTTMHFSTPVGPASSLLAFWGGWLLLQFARVELLWPFSFSDNDGAGRSQSLPNKAAQFKVLFGCLFVSLIGLVVVASMLIWPGAELESRQATSTHLAPALTFSGLIGTAFLPLLTAFWLEAHHEAKVKKFNLWRPDVVSPFWFVVITGGIGVITVLAYYAAIYTTETISAAISYATFVGIFLLFVLVIVAPHIVKLLQDRSENQIAKAERVAMNSMGLSSLELPARWLSYLDSFLVRVVAPLSGGTQRQLAHAHVILSLGLLSLLGLIIPRPFGLVPIVLGIVLAVALGRRWAWVEEDRETASRLERTSGPNIHVGFENDLKDEALTGYAGLFILVPLTLYQIQDLTGFQPSLNEQSGNILLTWIVFFGGELAKAVPFVDWWDIYGNQDISNTGKHLTFVSRAAVDFVILAALFQALSIWQRNRVQTTLYRDGHLSSFDPFKEQEFFQRGVVRMNGQLPDGHLVGHELFKAKKFEDRIEHLRNENRLFSVKGQNGPQTYYEIRKSFKSQVEAHVKAQGALLNEHAGAFESPSPYSRQRLGELIERCQNEDIWVGASWMVKQWGVLVGTPIDQLNQIASRWAAQGLNHSSVAPPRSALEWRIQKVEFERILVELAQPRWFHQVNNSQIKVLMDCLFVVKNQDEFDFARILALELMGFLKTEFAILSLSNFVLSENDLIRNSDWKSLLIGSNVGPEPKLRMPRVELRERVYDATLRVAQNASAGDSARKRALELLTIMSEVDGAQAGRNRAKTCATDARNALKSAGLID